MKWSLILLVLTLAGRPARAQAVITLYSGPIPGAIPSENREFKKPDALVDSLTLQVSVPNLTVFAPPKGNANGMAVIICPGGGYGVLLTKREGSDVARALNKLGVTAFVLKYRLPDDRIMKDKSIGPLQDAQQAIRLVRERAAEFGIKSDQIGIMGFSAGGHLASSAGTHFGKRYIDPDGKTSLRPDFMILINPVVSFNDTTGHIGSRDRLLGPAARNEQIRLFSNEQQVDSLTPPAILIHSGADVVVPVANSLRFYDALRKNGVAAAIHVYSKGEHGFLTYPSFGEWFGRVEEWLRVAL